MFRRVYLNLVAAEHHFCFGKSSSMTEVTKGQETSVTVRAKEMNEGAHENIKERRSFPNLYDILVYGRYRIEPRRRP